MSSQLTVKSSHLVMALVAFFSAGVLTSLPAWVLLKNAETEISYLKAEQTDANNKLMMSYGDVGWKGAHCPRLNAFGADLVLKQVPPEQVKERMKRNFTRLCIIPIAEHLGKDS